MKPNVHAVAESRRSYVGRWNVFLTNGNVICYVTTRTRNTQYIAARLGAGECQYYGYFPFATYITYYVHIS